MFIFIVNKYFMNVLILTPDRVGSTLLQRLITVYMQAHDYGAPVINLHELTNGVIKYYSPVFAREVLGKPNGQPWGYFQSLDEITNLLHGTDHWKTSRLAHYHILNRQDSLAAQVPFYQYLNDNFFIISARRDSLFEHALSWCIQTRSKKLNVYSHQEKIDAFSEIYDNKIEMQPQVMIRYLNQYVKYLKWCDNHFNIGSYFYYDRDFYNLEQYILSLPMFQGRTPQTWKQMFDIEFADWNRCHYLLSDLSGISEQLPPAGLPQLEHSQPTESSYQLQSLSRSEIALHLKQNHAHYIKTHTKNYLKTAQGLEQLVANKVLVTPVPIKLQTMLEKKLLFKNFDQLVEVYNSWVDYTGHGRHYVSEQEQTAAVAELQQWYNTTLLD
jgi:hypothetical protein